MAIPVDTAIGTELFFVPCRYWEKEYEILTGSLAVQQWEDGSIHPSVAGKHVYAFVDEDDHNGYMEQEDTFLTKREAELERVKRCHEKEIQDHLDTERFMEQIYKSYGIDRNKKGA